ncbi:helix-turn-helix transcriptional regulator [Streptomyces sp. NPDC001920]
MHLVGRERELKTLRRLFTEGKKGSVQLAVVSGAVASGKSALLHAFAREVVSEGAVFLQATGSRTERALPLGVIGQIIASSAPFAENDDNVRRLTEAATHSISTAEAKGPRSLWESQTDVTGGLDVRAPSVVSQALYALSNRAPVVIGVDDVHYADVLSLEALLYLIRRASLRPARVFLVLNRCDEPEFSHPRFDAELLRHPHCHQIRLKLLSRDGVAEILAEDLGMRASRRVAASCHDATGGNPLLVHAMLEDHHAEARAPGAELIPGDAFARAVSACLYRGAPLTLNVARAMAVMGKHATLPVLTDVLGSDPESLARAISALHGLGLLRSGRFRHDAAREAVLWSPDGADRSDLHGEAARVLHEHGASATVVAQHLSSAGRADGDWTVPVLREAADEALAANDSDSAIAWLRMAGRASTDEREQAAITAALVRAKWRGSPEAALPYMPGLSAAALDNRLEFRDAVALVGHLLWFGQTEQVLDILEAMQRHGSGTTKELDPIRMGLGWAFPGLFARHRVGHVNSGLEAHAPAARISTGNALYVSPVLPQSAGDDALGAAEQTLLGARLDDHTLPTLSAALVSLIHLNQLDRAVHWGDSLLRQAAQRRASMWQALLANLRAFIDIRRGRMATAERFARDALTLVSTKSWGVAVGSPIANMVLAATALGKLDSAAAYLSIPVPEAMFDTMGALHYLQARGRYHLAMDCPHAALSDFQACGDLMMKWELDDPRLVAWRTDAAQASAALGHTNQVRDLLTEQLAGASPDDFRTRGVSLRILGAVEKAEDSTALLGEAVENLRESGDLFELALGLVELARTHDGRGHRDEARELTRMARGLAEKTGVELVGVPSHRRTPGGTAPRPSGAPEGPPVGTDRRSQLTDAELRVAVLAARGKSNRQIAAKLFITISTVEQHLTSVYRKLNAKRRTDLSTELQSVLVTGGNELPPTGPETPTA